MPPIKKPRRFKAKPNNVVVYDPEWAYRPEYKDFNWTKHPLSRGELVYFIGPINNAIGHCVVATFEGKVVPMIHPQDLRMPTEKEF